MVNFRILLKRICLTLWLQRFLCSLLNVSFKWLLWPSFGMRLILFNLHDKNQWDIQSNKLLLSWWDFTSNSKFVSSDKSDWAKYDSIRKKQSAVQQINTSSAPLRSVSRRSAKKWRCPAGVPSAALSVGFPPRALINDPMKSPDDAGMGAAQMRPWIDSCFENPAADL